MTQEELETAARMYEEVAAELERAVGHCRTSGTVSSHVAPPMPGLRAVIS